MEVEQEQHNNKTTEQVHLDLNGSLKPYLGTTSVISTLTTLVQACKLPDPFWEFGRDGYYASVSLKLAGKNFIATGFKNKKEAKRVISAAALKYLRDLGIYEEFFEENGKSHVTLLQNYCQGQGASPPEFRVVSWNAGTSRGGAESDNIGPYGAKVSVLGMTFQSQRKHARRRGAKEDVARIALLYLTSPPSARIGKPLNGVDKSKFKYRDLLAEYTATRPSMGRPHYSLRCLGSGRFEAQVVVGATQYLSTGDFASKNEAMEDAAKHAYEMLVSDNAENEEDFIPLESSKSESQPSERSSTQGPMSVDSELSVDDPGIETKQQSEPPSTPLSTLPASTGSLLGKRQRPDDEVNEDGGPQQHRIRVQTYVDRLNKLLAERQATPPLQPHFSFIPSEEEPGLLCVLEIGDKRWTTGRPHVEKEDAKEDVCGDAYKELCRKGE
ncbi:hypothetical protein HK104_002972 [Borealophlyctis nickersoniae]|nr:hypothetical protein HK104_002972 [Borealophlyctis nickersoniae]